MATAAIKFTQGATTDLAGRAVIGVTGAAVACTNGNNTGITSWLWELVDKPAGSALVLGTLSATASASFTPDVAGTYQVRLTVNGLLVDRRDFIVPTAQGFLVPARGSDATTFNHGGQANGWKDAVNDLLTAVGKFIDTQGNVICTPVQYSSSQTIAANAPMVRVRTGAPLTLTMPAHVAGKLVHVFNHASSGGTVTISPGSGQIDGGSSYALPAGSSVLFQSDGTNWLLA